MNLRTRLTSHLSLVAATALAAGLLACGSATPAPSSPDHTATAEARTADQDGAMAPSEAERAAYERAKPVFDRYCAGCHTSAGNGPAKAKEKAREHLAMDQYPFGGHHAHEAGEEVAEALGLTGKKASMPKNNPGVVQGDDLALVKAWVDAYEEAHPASATHEHEDEEHEGKGDHNDGEEHEGDSDQDDD